MAGVVESILLDVQVKGTDALKGVAKHLTEIGEAAATSAKGVSKLNRQAGRLASKLDTVGDAARSVGDGLSSVGDGAREASVRIKGAGDESRKTAKKTETLRDRLGDVATLFRDSGDGGMMFADALDAASVATSAFGVGVLGVVAGLGAAKLAFDALSASVALYVETNAEAAAASDRLDVAIGTLNESAVDLAIGEGNLTKITEGLTIVTETASQGFDKIRERMDDGSDSGMLFRAVMEGTIGAITGTGLALRVTSTAAQALVDANTTLIGSNSSLIGSFGGVVTSALNAADAIKSAARETLVMLGLAESTTFKGAKQIMSGLAATPLGKRLSAGYQSLKTQLAPRRGGGGGGGGRRRDALQSGLAQRNAAFINQQYAGLISRSETGGVSADDITGALLGDPDFIAAREAEGGSILAASRREAAAAKDAAKDAERRRREAARMRERQAEKRRQALEKEAAAARKLAGVFRTELQGSVAGLGVAAATTFGEMAAGAISAAGAMRSLAQEIANVGAAIGRTAAQRGVEGLIAGTAGAGGALAGGLGLAAGAGLLAAVVARRQRNADGDAGGTRSRRAGSRRRANRLFGDLLAGRDTRQRRGDSTARLADSIDRLEQTLRPDRADTPVTLNAEIVIAGRTVQQELTGALDSIVRTRSSRELFRAGIGR